MLDFVVLGAYGMTTENGHQGQVDMRKFLKDPNHVGPTSDGLLRTSKTSLILTKSTALAVGESSTWVMATDHSACSQTAFALLIRRMVKPGDTVKVLHIGPVKDDDAHVDLYKKELSNYQVNGEVVFVEDHGEMNVADRIVNFAEKKEADFLVMGICGHSQAKLGSVSTRVMRTARCTTIMIKDPREMAMERTDSLALHAFPH